MVIEIPRWLDDEIAGQKWTLIGVAALVLFWAGYIAWYVAFATRPPPPRAFAPRTVASCPAVPHDGMQREAAHEPPCPGPRGERAPRPPAGER